MDGPTDLTVRRVPLTDLHRDPANVRLHDPRNLSAITDSLARFGQQKPIVVDASGRVLAGNGTFEAAEHLGWSTIHVVESSLEAIEATAYAIADNRTSDLSEFDEPSLARLLVELRDADALGGVGFDDADLAELLAGIDEVGPDADLDDPGPDEPRAEAVSRTGDLWLLGDHRLLCGDSTSADDVARVMAGDQAALCATDPPYLVDYTGDRPNNSGKDWTADYREVDIQDADGFFRSVFTQVLTVIAPHAAVYCWHAHRRCGVIQNVWAELGILDHQQIIWVKPTKLHGRVFWHFRHEPCLMGWRQGSMPQHDGDHQLDTVWEVDWEGKQRVVGNEHPTQKPVELFARPMRKHTRRGDVVLEPFSGSGSQLIAAEQLSRRCRALEISPVFVDVAIRRWQTATGREARLEDGRTFADVASDRGIES